MVALVRLTTTSPSNRSRPFQFPPYKGGGTVERLVQKHSTPGGTVWNGGTVLYVGVRIAPAPIYGGYFWGREIKPDRSTRKSMRRTRAACLVNKGAQ